MAQTFTRVSQQAARYKWLGSAMEHCSQCRFFLKNNLCARVIGDVAPGAWCRFFSREAVMRGDAGGGAAATHAGSGGPPGLALDLSFMTPGTLDPRITFTRASVGTYFDVVGVLQTATTNTPRWDYDPVTHALRGLLIEEQRVNSVIQSGDFTNASWNKGSCTIVAGIPGPNGATTGSGVISNNGAIGFLGQSITPVAGTTYTSSCFAKAGSLTTVQFLMPGAWFTGGVNRFGTYDLVAVTATPSVGGSTAAIAPVGNGWFRISLTATPDLAVAGSIQFARAFANGDGVTVQHYAFGAQVETGAFATSYIPTTAAAVTRAQDYPSLPPANMAWFTPPGGSWFAEFIRLNPTVPLTERVIGRIGAGAAITPLSVHTGLGAIQYDGAAGTPTANPTTTGVIAKAATTWAVGAATTCLNAGTVVSTAAQVTGYGGLVGAGLTFLQNPTTPIECMTGYLRRVQYWPRALSNSELQQVTT